LPCNTVPFPELEFRIPDSADSILHWRILERDVKEDEIVAE